MSRDLDIDVDDLPDPRDAKPEPPKPSPPTVQQLREVFNRNRWPRSMPLDAEAEVKPCKHGLTAMVCLKCFHELPPPKRTFR